MPKKRNSNTLTIPELNFCHYIEQGLSGTQAIIKAYENINNENVAAVTACKLLRKAKIQDWIKKQKQAIINKYGVTVEGTIAELAKCGFSNIQDYIGEINQIDDISQIERDKAAAVESVQTTTTITRNKKGDKEYETKNVKIKLHKKLDALEQLGKHLGIFEKDNQQRERNIPAVIIVGAPPPKLVESEEVDT